MRPIYEVIVESDDFTKAASTAFDYKFEGRSTFEGWEKPSIPEDFSIGLILGPSGSGKSLLLKQFGQESSIEWNPNKATVSHFETPEDALDRLMAVGLNSIPSWCRPFHVLSNGEQFRANLARKLQNGAVVDEFTSVVDRNVAKAASTAMRRYVDRKGLKGIVLASCHYDILEWLRPDWYFDTVDGILHDGRSLQRPAIGLQVYSCDRSAWRMFAKHHYLTEVLSRSCRAYLATAVFNLNELERESEETVVGFSSTIPFPNGNWHNGWREHRTVVLPDFQGLGLGPKIADMIGQMYIEDNKRYFSRTAHPRFGKYRDRSPLWKATTGNHVPSKRTFKEGNASKIQGTGRWDGDDRVCYSHEYIGKK